MIARVNNRWQHKNKFLLLFFLTLRNSLSNSSKYKIIIHLFSCSYYRQQNFFLIISDIPNSPSIPINNAYIKTDMVSSKMLHQTGTILLVQREYDDLLIIHVSETCDPPVMNSSGLNLIPFYYISSDCYSEPLNFYNSLKVRVR